VLTTGGTGPAPRDVTPEATLAVDHPALDRPRFRALIAKARLEHERGGPPHAYRELFRELKALVSVER
jgi:ribosome-associated protein